MLNLCEDDSSDIIPGVIVAASMHSANPLRQHLPCRYPNQLGLARTREGELDLHELLRQRQLVPVSTVISFFCFKCECFVSKLSLTIPTAVEQSASPYRPYRARGKACKASATAAAPIDVQRIRIKSSVTGPKCCESILRGSVDA